MITNTFLNEIAMALNRFIFSKNDFSIIYNYEDGIHIKITYRYMTNYYFTFSFSDQDTDQFIITRSPGSFMQEEQCGINGKPNLLLLIREWVEDLNKEMRYMPIRRELESIRDGVDTFEEKFSEIPDTFFTRAESDLLKCKLENLERQFEEKLKKEITEKQTLEEEMSKIKADIETLKNQIDFLNKKGWIKSFSTKLYEWGNKHPLATVMIASAGLNLIPDEIKQIIPMEELINTILPPEVDITTLFEGNVEEGKKAGVK